MPREIIAGVVATKRTLIKSSVIGISNPSASLSCFFLAAFLHRFQQADACSDKRLSTSAVPKRP